MKRLGAWAGLAMMVLGASACFPWIVPEDDDETHPHPPRGGLYEPEEDEPAPTEPQRPDDTPGRGSDGGDKRVFVTSVAYSGNLIREGNATTGREGANALCQVHADDARLGGEWVAWLSDNQGDAIDQLNEGRFALVDGTEIFASKLDIRRGPRAALNLDERGLEVNASLAWTGTNDRGRVTGEWSNCNEWGQDYSWPGTAGSIGALDSTWTDSGQQEECTSLLRLYCFEL